MNNQNLKPLSTKKAREIGAKRRKSKCKSKTQKEIHKRAVGDSNAVRYE